MFNDSYFNNIDLRLENYTFDELIKLFSISKELTLEDMKIAKKVVMRVHPDKSGLNKKIFHFYYEAYKFLRSIYEMRESQHTNYTNADDIVEFKLDKNCLKKINSNDFNTKFNEVFEKVRIDDPEFVNGYNDWLRNTIEVEAPIDKMQHEQKLNEIHNEGRIVIADINTFQNNIGGSSILRESKNDYSCEDVFSKLKYRDLKNAYEETFIQVDKNELEIKEKIKNTEQLKQQRHTQMQEGLPSIQQAKQMLETKERKMKLESNYNLFKIKQQDKERTEAHKKSLQYFLKLMNN